MFSITEQQNIVPLSLLVVSNLQIEVNEFLSSQAIQHRVA
jgi:hypothetical protein